MIIGQEKYETYAKSNTVRETCKAFERNQIDKETKSQKGSQVTNQIIRPSTKTETKSAATKKKLVGLARNTFSVRETLDIIRAPI